MRARDTPSIPQASRSSASAQEFISGETLHGLAKRHDLSRNLIRMWVQKFETGAFDEDAEAADITYVPVVGRFVYVAVVLDAWSRTVVGYAISR